MIKSVNKIILYAVAFLVAYVLLANWVPFLNPFKKADITIIESALVVDEIKNNAELFNAKYYTELVLDTVKYDSYESTDFSGSLMHLNHIQLKDSSKKEIVLIASGHCYAGTDLNQLSIETFDDSLYTIKVPESKVLNTVVNPSDFTVYYEEGKWSPVEINQIKSSLRARVKSNAISNGILDMANSRTQELLVNFFQSVNPNRAYKVEFISNKAATNLD